MRSGVSVGPESNFRGSVSPVARILTWVPPTSITSTFMTSSRRCGQQVREIIVEKVTNRGHGPVRRRVGRDDLRVVGVFALPDEDGGDAFAPGPLDRRQDAQLVVAHHVVLGRVTPFDVGQGR